MNTPLSVVEKFLELTNDKHDIAGAAKLMAKDIRFAGPVMEFQGAQEYKAVLEKFLPVHAGWRKLAAFEKGGEACVIDELDLKSPAGGTVTLKVSEWFKVKDGLITDHAIFYDPREFAKAFGI